jgi:hypothetical protein
MHRGTPRVRGRMGRVIAPLAGAALAACLVACSTPAATTAPEPDLTPVPTPSAAAPTPSVDVPIQSGALPAPTTPVPPVRLRIDALGIDMPVTDVGVEPTGQMELPEDPAVAGWYRYGPDATSTAGNVVVAAHVDSPRYPIGPLARLREVGVGTPLVVDGADGTARTYVVESLTYYEKAALPTAELFAREGAPALVLITCGGPFDSSTGHYRDNVVAIARPR